MDKKRYRCVLLFGPPGVGKGTQGGVLGNIPGFFHLAVGDVFRSIDINSDEGKEVYKYSSQGELVPDELTIKIWKRALEAYVVLSWYKPWEDLLVLDGIPRNINQCRLIAPDLDVLKVIHLECTSDEKMVDRIKRRAIRENRPDDANEDVIRNRFKIYHETTAPVLDYYSDKIVTSVEADGSPAEVLSRILEALIPAQNICYTTPW